MEDEAPTTTLSLYNAVGILDNIVNEQNEASNCHICHKKLDISFTICSTQRGSDNNSHTGHSACKECVDSNNYIGANGRCKACIMETVTRRSALAKAGIALIPPSQNKMSTDLIGILRKAENEISEIKDGQEQQRIQESADRRVAAVEEVKKRRMEEEERVKQMKIQAEMEAKKIIDDAVEEEEIVKKRKVQAELDAKKIIDDAEVQADEIRTKAIRTMADNSQIVDQDKPKRKPMSEESLEKRRKTFADRKDKVEKFDQLVNENSILRQLLANYVDTDEIDSMIQKSVFEVD